MEYKIGTDARCAVIGYGSWATAIVGLLAANGRRVGWYVRNPEVLESMPPELYADIVKNGIYLAGGGALIKGLDRRLNEKTGIPFHIAEDPLRAIARGTGIALKNINRFSFLMK